RRQPVIRVVAVVPVRSIRFGGPRDIAHVALGKCKRLLHRHLVLVLDLRHSVHHQVSMIGVPYFFLPISPHIATKRRAAPVHPTNVFRQYSNCCTENSHHRLVCNRMPLLSADPKEFPVVSRSQRPLGPMETSCSPVDMTQSPVQWPRDAFAIDVSLV